MIANLRGLDLSAVFVPTAVMYTLLGNSAMYQVATLTSRHGTNRLAYDRDACRAFLLRRRPEHKLFEPCSSLLVHTDLMSNVGGKRS